MEQKAIIILSLIFIIEKLIFHKYIFLLWQRRDERIVNREEIMFYIQRLRTQYIEMIWPLLKFFIFIDDKYTCWYVFLLSINIVYIVAVKNDIIDSANVNPPALLCKAKKQ